MRPAAVAITAETSDHQKPGAPRAANVVTQPIRPATRKIQPKMMVTAIVASGGSRIATTPSARRTIPSTRKNVECSRMAPATAAWIWFGSAGCGADIGGLRHELPAPARSGRRARKYTWWRAAGKAIGFQS